MTEDWFHEERATFGDRLTAAREAAGLSSNELARRLGVGAKTVAAWEEDQSEPRANRMQMLAGILNVSLMWLMTGEGPGVAPPGDDSAARSPAELAAIQAEVQALQLLIRQAGERIGRLDERLNAAMEEQD